MNIRFIIVLCFLVLCAKLQAQQFEPFKINGSEKSNASKAYFMYYDFADGNKIIDSAKIVNNKFSFQGEIEGPCYGGIVFGDNFEVASEDWANKKNLWFTLFKGQTNISFSEDKPKVVGGNKGLEEEKDYKNVRNVKRAVFNSEEYMSDTYRIAQQKRILDSLSKNLIAKFGQPEDVNKLALKEFIAKNPNSEYSLYELKQHLTYIKNYEEAQALYELLSPELRQTNVGTKLGALINTFKIKEGVEAIEFAQADVNGAPIKLSDFKGKYVLVDFWASWCVPCRKENPTLVKAYTQFKNKNFEILGVSLDSKKENWLEAIAADGLTWKHVSDLKGWKNEVAVQYGIRAVPANFLIDPSGKIIAKDLRGEQLIEVLSKTLK